jgi:hypothetical protein
MNNERFARLWRHVCTTNARLLAILATPPAIPKAPPPPEPWGKRYLPIIEDLDAAKSDFERASWLLTTPLAILYKHSMPIREVLSAAGYNKGHNYVLLVFATFSMRRDLDGNIRGPMHTALEQAIEDLREDAERPPLRASHDERVLAAADLTIHPAAFMGVDLAEGQDLTVETFWSNGVPQSRIVKRAGEDDALTFNWPEPKTQPTS